MKKMFFLLSVLVFSSIIVQQSSAKTFYEEYGVKTRIIVGDGLMEVDYPGVWEIWIEDANSGEIRKTAISSDAIPTESAVAAEVGESVKLVKRSDKWYYFVLSSEMSADCDFVKGYKVRIVVDIENRPDTLILRQICSTITEEISLTGNTEREFLDEFQWGKNVSPLESIFGVKIHPDPISEPHQFGVSWTFVTEDEWQMNNFSRDCAGKEWSLGRAIQVAPTFSTNPKWPKWKAKIGVCRGGAVSFIQDAYFQSAAPSATQLTAAFGKSVHSKPWHTVPEKQRTFYVFASDYEAEMSRRGAFIGSTILPLLLSEKREIGPGPTAYTPESPNGTAENDPALTLSADAWQRMYPVGAMYCQVEVRSGGAKVKFGQRISDTTVKWFDIRYDVPVDPSWSLGLAPFHLSATFPGYVFKNAQYPGDESDIWTARVLIPGYKHPVYSPESPSSSADGEGIIYLTSESWQQRYPNGALYCQIDVRTDGAKVKFLQKLADRAVPYAVFRQVPVDSGWELGQPPFNLLMAFPEYDFGSGFYPVGEETEWAARVYLW